MVVKLGGATVTVINPGAATGYNGVGDPIYGDPTLTVVNNCSLQQHRTSRAISTTDVAIARLRLFAPAWAPLRSDSIVANGSVDSWPLAEGDETVWYLVDGDPAVWNDQNGAADHTECYLKQQTG